MKSQVLELSELGIINSSLIAVDSTPISANTSQNNPKALKKNKFSKSHHPKNDKDCKFGGHTALTPFGEKGVLHLQMPDAKHKQVLSLKAPPNF